MYLNMSLTEARELLNALSVYLDDHEDSTISAVRDRLFDALERVRPSA